jgi:hypothetical protein
VANLQGFFGIKRRRTLKPVMSELKETTNTFFDQLMLDILTNAIQWYHF